MTAVGLVGRNYYARGQGRQTTNTCLQFNYDKLASGDYFNHQLLPGDLLELLIEESLKSFRDMQTGD